MRSTPADHVVEVDEVAGRLRQRLVDERDRADPRHALVERLLGLLRVEPPRLQPQQRRDRLQVVLHAVVDLADDRVLEHEHAVAAAELGDVLHEDEPAFVRPFNRNGTTRRLITSPPISTSVPCGVAVSMADHKTLPPVSSSSCRPTSSRYTPRRRLAAIAFGDAKVMCPASVDDHQSFTDARRLPRFHALVRERALGDHVEEHVAARRVRLLEIAHAASAERHALAEQHGGHAAADPDGDRRAMHAAAVDASGLDLPLRERLHRLRRELGEQRGADVVVRVEGLRSQRADLRERQEVLVGVVRERSEQQDVGEREVGEHLPHRDEPMEVIDLVLGDPAGARAELFEKRRHRVPIVVDGRDRRPWTPVARLPRRASGCRTRGLRWGSWPRGPPARGRPRGLPPGGRPRGLPRGGRPGPARRRGSTRP